MKPFSLFIFSLINVKFEPKDLDFILGGGLYQCSTIFKRRDKYATIINWVYTHLFFGFQYFSNNQFLYNTMVLEISKSQGTFQSFVNSFMTIVYSLKLLK
jgi:hypothetical protein